MFCIFPPVFSTLNSHGIGVQQVAFCQYYAAHVNLARARLLIFDIYRMTTSTTRDLDITEIQRTLMVKLTNAREESTALSGRSCQIMSCTELASHCSHNREHC